ncbi:MAG: MMPL family transporter [Planctomycetaceae bacterium]
MFERFGALLARIWPTVLAVWIAAVALAAYFAPPLDDVVKTGEFAFLPEDSPSRKTERLFEQAFQGDKAASRVVIVARRLSNSEGLTEKDLDFIDDGLDTEDKSQPFELKERLVEIARRQEGPNASEGVSEDAKEDGDPETGDFGPKSDIHRIRTFRDKTVGHLLLSKDKKATLVYVELRHEFMDAKNRPTIQSIEQLLFEDEEFRRQIPAGLDLTLSGEAVVGRDMLDAAKISANATEHLTIVLVVILLMLIYRAPLLAFIPLATVAVSVKLTMLLLQIGAERGWVILFQGIESYVTVLLYGAGVDYCLFLIARYKEEIDEGKSYRDAVIGAVGKVGEAIAASAGTVICGIGMMIFAEFGKFHDAGIAISFGLVIVLAALTFTPRCCCSRDAGCSVGNCAVAAASSGDGLAAGALAGEPIGRYEHRAEHLGARRSSPVAAADDDLAGDDGVDAAVRPRRRLVLLAPQLRSVERLVSRFPERCRHESRAGSFPRRGDGHDYGADPQSEGRFRPARGRE